MTRKSMLAIGIVSVSLVVLGGTAAYAQDKYSLKSPSGIAFSDFRGYEDWAVRSSARTDEVLKVIVANPTMIKAYKAGVPGGGQPSPAGSMIVKLQWKPKKSTEAPFAVDVPDVCTQAFVIEKDSKRFPKSGGWGYAVFNYEAASDISNNVGSVKSFFERTSPFTSKSGLVRFLRPRHRRPRLVRNLTVRPQTSLRSKLRP